MTDGERPIRIDQHQTMLALIAAYTQLSAEKTDRASITERVMRALARVPRHRYVPLELEHVAYEDTPLPIGCGKTISQPFIVALMTDLLELEKGSRVLEVGTGLGYQTAVLAELAGQVFTIEIIEDLAEDAVRRLKAAGYGNIHTRIGDGSQGWPQHAPFDRIIVTAAPELMPGALLQQLKPGGRMVIPAGLEDQQQLLLVTKDAEGRIATKEVMQVLFSQLVSSH